MSAALFDEDDVSRCPVGSLCELCGATGWLDVVTFDAAGLGVFCATVCGACTDEGRWPRVPVATALGRVCEHCMHRGVDLDGNAAEPTETVLARPVRAAAASSDGAEGDGPVPSVPQDQVTRGAASCCIGAGRRAVSS